MPRLSLLRSSLLAATSLLSACSGAQFLNTVTFWGDYTRHADLPYGAGSETLDVYTPRDAQDAPVVVFIYGGSWQHDLTLPKARYKFIGEALTARGFVVVIPDYRVYPEVHYPTFIQDCARAVRWTRDHVGDYGGDAHRIVLVGHSAGAYNAAMLVLDHEFLAAEGVAPGTIRGFVGLSGPYDFLPLTDDVLKQVFASPDLAQTQPVNHVSGDNPPMLLLHGADDDTVYPRNTEHLAQRVRDKGGAVDVHIYPHMSHVKMVATISTLLQRGSDVADRITTFVRSVTATGIPAAQDARPGQRRTSAS